MDTSGNGITKSMTSFVDIICILLTCFMLITALLAANISKEYLAKVDLLKKEKRLQTDGPGPGEAAVFLTITKYKTFILEGKKIGPAQKLASQEKVKQALKRLTPSKLYLRVDASVPTGTTQSVMLDCQEMGILPYLVTENRKEG